MVLWARQGARKRRRRQARGSSKAGRRRHMAFARCACCVRFADSIFIIGLHVCTLDCFDRWQASCQSISALPCRLLRRTSGSRCLRLACHEMLATYLPLK